MTKVLIVDDSAVMREVLAQILRSDPEIAVVGTASNGQEALEAVGRLRPDVVTMDVSMPGMNGFDVTRRIMETHATPTIIVTASIDPSETATAFRALQSGALAVLLKPSGIGHPAHDEAAAELVRTVKTMAQVKVVRRWERTAARAQTWTELPRERTAPGNIAMVAIGASTGGPQALATILPNLRPGFPAPVLVVQHIAAGFTAGLAEWLNQASALPVRIAAQSDITLPGHVYLAPEGVHMGIGRDGSINLIESQPEYGVRPSVAVLFRSVANHYGANCAAVLLSGMGRDGAAELKQLKDLGAATIAQDRDTSVVHGMPGEAIRLGGATYTLPVDAIAPALTALLQRGGGARTFPDLMRVL